jgi:hypothetical protein
MPIITQEEFERLAIACRNLPSSSVQIDETEIARAPILLLMSSVLSLTRKWYLHVIPARRYFEKNVYPKLESKSLELFLKYCDGVSRGRTDWHALAQNLWARNEWTKAQQLTGLIEYLIVWKSSNAAAVDDLGALQLWSRAVAKEDFLGKIKGLGPRAYEQMRWYIDGKDSIKIDRHVVRFVGDVVERQLSAAEIEKTLKEIARSLNITPTTLDAQIWDYMQAKGGVNSRSLGCVERN